MNYEQKYKQALERAMKLALTGNVDALAAGEIFPELKESEDDRIKREIVNYIYTFANINNEKIPTEWLEWLEKQGEKNAKMIDADEVIEWMKTHGNLLPVVTIRINDVIAKFKEDFGL